MRLNECSALWMALLYGLLLFLVVALFPAIYRASNFGYTTLVLFSFSTLQRIPRKV